MLISNTAREHERFYDTGTPVNRSEKGCEQDINWKRTHWQRIILHISRQPLLFARSWHEANQGKIETRHQEALIQSKNNQQPASQCCQCKDCQWFHECIWSELSKRDGHQKPMSLPVHHFSTSTSTLYTGLPGVINNTCDHRPWTQIMRIMRIDR